MKFSPLILDETRRRLGVAGLCGLALALVALIYLAVIVFPSARRLMVREEPEQVAQLERPVARPSGDAAAVQFLASLPDVTTTASVLSEIYGAASREHISLARAEYQMATGSDPVFQLYQINAPVRGDYVQIRRFIHAALARVPYMALEEVSFRRKAIGEHEIEARIRFTVYLRKDRA